MMQIVYTALCALIFTTCVSLRATTAASSPLPLYFGYIISGNSSDFGGAISTADTVTAVDLALRRINNDPFLLSGYELRYQATLDSQVQSLLHVWPASISIYGNVCISIYVRSAKVLPSCSRLWMWSPTRVHEICYPLRLTSGWYSIQFRGALFHWHTSVNKWNIVLL